MTMHLRRQDTTGKLILISLLYTQLELGTARPFLNEDFEKYGNYITSTRLTNIWSYSSSCNLKIHVHNAKQYVPPRANDFFLMDLVYDSVTNPDHIHIFNHVRIALKVLTAADIVAVGHGYSILEDVKNRKSVRNSSLGWQHSEKLPPSWIKMWKMILEIVVQPHIRAKPLGVWNEQGHQTWQCHTDPHTNLISNADSTFVRRTRTRFGSFVKDSVYKPVSHPCDAHVISNNTIQIISKGSIFPTSDAEKHEGSPLQKFRSINDWRKRNWGTAPISDSIIKKTKCLLQKNVLVACSDGSTFPESQQIVSRTTLYA